MHAGKMACMIPLTSHGACSILRCGHWAWENVLHGVPVWRLLTPSTSLPRWPQRQPTNRNMIYEADVPNQDAWATCGLPNEWEHENMEDVLLLLWPTELPTYQYPHDLLHARGPAWDPGRYHWGCQIAPCSNAIWTLLMSERAWSRACTCMVPPSQHHDSEPWLAPYHGLEALLCSHFNFLCSTLQVNGITRVNYP